MEASCHQLKRYTELACRSHANMVDLDAVCQANTITTSKREPSQSVLTHLHYYARAVPVVLRIPRMSFFFL